ncbi:hypothetical protein GCM10009531_61990 [Actinoplanes capillaceus]
MGDHDTASVCAHPPRTKPRPPIPGDRRYGRKGAIRVSGKQHRDYPPGVTCPPGREAARQG